MDLMPEPDSGHFIPRWLETSLVIHMRPHLFLIALIMYRWVRKPLKTRILLPNFIQRTLASCVSAVWVYNMFIVADY